MVEIIKRDEVIKRQAQEFQDCTDVVCKLINDKLGNTKDYPILFTDNYLFNQFSRELKINVHKVKNEVFRILKESGWTVTPVRDGFELS